MDRFFCLYTVYRCAIPNWTELQNKKWGVGVGKQFISYISWKRLTYRSFLPRHNSVHGSTVPAIWNFRVENLVLVAILEKNGPIRKQPPFLGRDHPKKAPSQICNSLWFKSLHNLKFWQWKSFFGRHLGKNQPIRSHPPFPGRDQQPNVAPYFLLFIKY